MQEGGKWATLFLRTKCCQKNSHEAHSQSRRCVKSQQGVRSCGGLRNVEERMWFCCLSEMGRGMGTVVPVHCVVGDRKGSSIFMHALSVDASFTKAINNCDITAYMEAPEKEEIDAYVAALHIQRI
jgi:hypothetical protein